MSQVSHIYLQNVSVHSLYVPVQTTQLLEDAGAIGTGIRRLALRRVVHSENMRL